MLLMLEFTEVKRNYNSILSIWASSLDYHFCFCEERYHHSKCKDAIRKESSISEESDFDDNILITRLQTGHEILRQRTTDTHCSYGYPFHRSYPSPSS